MSPQSRMTIVKSGMVKTRLTSKARPAPSLFFLPGINNSKTFWDRNDSSLFPWVKHIERNVDIIKDEYAQLQRDLASSDYKLQDGEQKLHTGSWNWNSFIHKGKWQREMTRKCPETACLLREIPDLLLNMPTSYCFFSTLGPSSKIEPHFGPCNLRLRCHLPLEVPNSDPCSDNAPKSCAIRVGNEWKAWYRGEAMLFDDSYEHETYNSHTTHDRVVLLFDIWHPDITLEERLEFVDMFANA